MFVETVKGGKGNRFTYVRVVKSVRENGVSRKKLVENLGRLDELEKKLGENALEILKEKYREDSKGRIKQKEENRLNVIKELLSASEETSAASDLDDGSLTLNYGFYPLRKIWDELTLDVRFNNLQKSFPKTTFSLNSLISYMVFCKVLDPQSVRCQFANRDQFLGNPVGKNASEAACYECLGVVHRFKNEIFKTVNKKMDENFGKDRASLVFYDVTNTYFESPLTDEERGHEQEDFEENLFEILSEEVAAGKLPVSILSSPDGIDIDRIPPQVWEKVQNRHIQYLRQRGPSKEHRTDLPLISVALVIDRNGFPMDYEVFSGNASEFKTMSQAVESLSKKYKFEKTVLVADRGLNSASNLKMLQEKGFGFLMAQKVTQFPAALRKELLDLDSYADLDEEGSDKFKVIPNYIKRNSKNPAEQIDTTLVLTFNEKRKRRDEEILKAWREIVEEKATKNLPLNAGRCGWRSIAKVEMRFPEEMGALSEEEAEALEKFRKKGNKGVPVVVGIDEKAFREKMQYCGFAGLVYKSPGSEPEEAFGDELEELGRRVASTYHILNQIEDCFRVMKSNLGFRPVRVWNSDHVKGHIGVCVLALLVMRLLQHKLKERGVRLSASRISEELREAQVAVLTSSSSLMFLRLRNHRNVRLGLERVPNKKLLEMIRAGKIKTNFLKEIMEACGLTPLPQVSSRLELERNLKTRFFKDSDTMSELAYELIRLV